MSRRIRIGSFTFAAFTALGSAAHATTEPPSTTDARAIGMGSTAVSHVHSAAAVYHNAALLHEVETLTLTANIAGSRIAQSAPLGGPGTSVDSEPSIVPLFLVGGAYRLSPDFVVGLAAFTTGGFGGEYETPAGPLKAVLGAMELSPTLTFSPTKTFAIGVGYRISYAMEEVTQPVPNPVDPMGPPLSSKLDLSGTNFAGFHLGVYFRPIERLKLGLAYRSKVTIEMDGTATLLGQDTDVTSDFAFPHAFKAGAAFEVLEDELLVAAELKYLMHADANEELVVEGPVPFGRQVQTLDWKDSLAVGLGAEYFALPILPVRAGYRVTMSATPEERPQALFPAPGPLHSIHLGAGIRLPSIDVDLGGFYAWGSKDVESPEMGSAPGEYTMKVTALSASVTYHL